MSHLELIVFNLKSCLHISYIVDRMEQLMSFRGFMMRALRGVLSSFALLCVLIAPSVVFSSEWVFCGRAEDGSREFYYDKESIITIPGQTRKAWIKYVWSERGRSEEILRRTKANLSTTGYENFTDSTQQHEFNCGTREYRILLAVDYGTSQKVLSSTESAQATWKSIIPDSLTEKLSKKVCGDQR
jgi:hypothetical protein